MADEICSICKHSLKNNNHGPDQNDMYMEGEEVKFTGTCTYCRECNPRIFKKEKHG